MKEKEEELDEKSSVEGNNRLSILNETQKYKEILSQLKSLHLEVGVETKEIMKLLSDKLTLVEMKILLKQSIKNEKFANFLQDLFLERLS